MPFRKHCLLNGLDDIGLTEQKGAEIGGYEAKARLARPVAVRHDPARAPEPWLSRAIGSNRKVLVLPGDGIGPEIMREVLRVVEFFDRRRIASFEISRGPGRRRRLRRLRRAADRCDAGRGAGGRRGAVRLGRRPEMGDPAVRAAARARPPAAAQGDGPVRQSAPGGGVRGAGRRLEPEARAGRRARSDDRARIDRRHLFRRAARHRDAARRQPPRHQHRGLHRGRDRARRPRRLRAGDEAPAPALRGRQGQRHGIGRAVARGRAAGAAPTTPMSSCRSCTPTIARCSWCATRSSST